MRSSFSFETFLQRNSTQTWLWIVFLDHFGDHDGKKKGTYSLDALDVSSVMTMPNTTTIDVGFLTSVPIASRLGASASPYMIVTLFPELLKEKEIALVRGEVFTDKLQKADAMKCVLS